MDPLLEAARGTVVGVVALTLSIAVAWQFTGARARVGLGLALALASAFGVGLILGAPRVPPAASDDRLFLVLPGALALVWIVAAIRPAWGRWLAMAIGTGLVCWFIVGPRASVALEFEQWTRGEAAWRFAIAYASLLIAWAGGRSIGHEGDERAPWAALVLAPVGFAVTVSAGLTGSLKSAQCASVIVAACSAWAVAALFAPTLRRGAGVAASWAAMALVLVALNGSLFADTPAVVALLVAIVPWLGRMGVWLSSASLVRGWIVGLVSIGIGALVIVGAAGVPQLLEEPEGAVEEEAEAAVEDDGAPNPYESFDPNWKPGG